MVPQVLQCNNRSGIIFGDICLKVESFNLLVKTVFNMCAWFVTILTMDQIVIESEDKQGFILSLDW